MTPRSIIGILLFWQVLFGSILASRAFSEKLPNVVLKYEIDPEGIFAERKG